MMTIGMDKSSNSLCNDQTDEYVIVDEGQFPEI